MATAALSIHLIARADDRFTSFTAGINARLIQSYEVRSAVEMRAIGARDLVNARSEAAQARAEAFVKSAHQDTVSKVATLQKMAENASMDPHARAAIAKIAEIESR